MLLNDFQRLVSKFTVDNELIPMLSFVKRQYYFEQAQDAFGDSDIVICCAPSQKDISVF